MTKPELSRRNLLAGLATAGGAGAFIGGGAAAVFSDEEMFTDNSLAASTAVSGEMELKVDIEWIKRDWGFDHPGMKYVPVWRITLPEEATNNPGYVWLRLRSCPTPWSFVRHVGVDLKGHGHRHTNRIAQGPLWGVSDELRLGVPLDPETGFAEPGEQACFEPGESLTVEFDWWLFSHFSGSGGTLSIPFEFHVRQCRYNDGTENPFPDVPSCGHDESHRKAISFVGFCSDTDDAIDPTITDVLDTDDDDDPTALEWETSTPVTHVVVKAGQVCKQYDYPGGATSGSVNSGGGDVDSDDVSYVSCNPPAPCAGTGADGSSDKIELEDEWGDPR